MEEVIKFAENLKRTKGRIDVIELANNYGIKVFSSNEVKGGTFIAFDKELNSYEIYVSSKESRERQRFSIAHELAHFIQHKEKIQEFGIVGRQNMRSLSAKEEGEADSLAAEILMPSSCVQDFLSENNITKECKITDKLVDKFANEFEVSAPASRIKLRDMGYYVRFA